MSCLSCSQLISHGKLQNLCQFGWIMAKAGSRPEYCYYNSGASFGSFRSVGPPQAGAGGGRGMLVAEFGFIRKYCLRFGAEGSGSFDLKFAKAGFGLVDEFVNGFVDSRATKDLGL